MSSKNNLQEMHDELFRRALHIKNTTDRFCFLQESILICDRYWDEADRSRLVKKMVTTFLKDYNLRPEFRTDVRMLDMWGLLGKYSKEYGMAGVLQKVDETGYFRKAVPFYKMWASYFSHEGRLEDMERVIEKCRKRCALSDKELDVHFGHLRPESKKAEDNETSHHVPVDEPIVMLKPAVVGHTPSLAAVGRRSLTSSPSPQYAQPPPAASLPAEEKMEHDGEELAPTPLREHQKENQPPVSQFVPPSPKQQKEAEHPEAPEVLPLATREEEQHFVESDEQKETSAGELDPFASPIANKPNARATGSSSQVHASFTRQELAPTPSMEQQKENQPPVSELVPQASMQQKEMEQPEAPRAAVLLLPTREEKQHFVESDEQKETSAGELDPFASPVAKKPNARATGSSSQVLASFTRQELAPTPPTEQHKENEPPVPAWGAPRASVLPLPTREEEQHFDEADEQKENFADELDQFASPVAKKHKARATGSSPQILASFTRKEPLQKKPTFPRDTFAEANIEQPAWELSASVKELSQTPSNVSSGPRGGPSLLQEAMDEYTCDSSFERSHVSVKACEGTPLARLTLTIQPPFLHSISADPNIKQSACENSTSEKEVHQTPSNAPCDRRGGPSLMQEARDDYICDSRFEPSPAALEPAFPRAIFTDPNIEQSAWESSALELHQTPSGVSSGRRAGPSLMQEAMDDNTYDSSFDGSPVTLRPPFPRATFADPNVGQSVCENSASEKELRETTPIVPSHHRFGLSPITEVMSDTTFEGSPVPTKPAFTRTIFADPNVEQSVWESSVSDKEFPQTPSSATSGRRRSPSPLREARHDTTSESPSVSLKTTCSRATYADPNVEQSAWDNSVFEKELHQTPSSVTNGRCAGQSPTREATGDAVLEVPSVPLKPAFAPAIFADPNVEQSVCESSVCEKELPQTPSSVLSDRRGSPSPLREARRDTTSEGPTVSPKPASPRATFAEPNVAESAWDSSELAWDRSMSEKELPQTPSSVSCDRRGGQSPIREITRNATPKAPTVSLQTTCLRATFADPNIEQSALDSSVFENKLLQTPLGVPRDHCGGPPPLGEVTRDATSEIPSGPLQTTCLRATFADPNIEQSALDSSVFENKPLQTPSSVPSDHCGGRPPLREVRRDATSEVLSVSLQATCPRATFADPNIELSAWDNSVLEKALPPTPSSVPNGRSVGQSPTREATGDTATVDSSVSLKPASTRTVFADPNVEQSIWENSVSERELSQTPLSVCSNRRGSPSPLREARPDTTSEGPSVSLKTPFRRVAFADPNIEQSALDSSVFDKELHQTPSSVPNVRGVRQTPTREAVGDATLESSSVSLTPVFARAIFADSNIEQSAWEISASKKELPQTPSIVSSGPRGGLSLMQEAMGDITSFSSFEGSPATLKTPLPRGFDASPATVKTPFPRTIFADPNIEQTVVEWPEEDTISKASSSSTSNQN